MPRGKLWSQETSKWVTDCYEKMHNTTQQGNADQNDNEALSPHTCQTQSSSKRHGQQVLVRMPQKKKKKEPHTTTDGNTN